MKEQVVAIQAQNIYAENKGYNLMPDTAVLETGVQQEQNVESSKTEEKEEKAIKEFKKQEKELRAQRRQELENRSSKEKTSKEKPQKHPLEAKYFPKGIPDDPEIQRRAYELCEAAGGKDLGKVDTQVLVKYFLLLDAQAQRARADRSFLKPVEEQLQGRGRNIDGLKETASEQVSSELREVWETDYKNRGIDPNSLSVDEKRVIEELVEKRLVPQTGGAENIDTTDINRIELARVAREINSEAADLGEREFDPEYLREQATRIRTLIDTKDFNDEEAEQAIRFINTLNQRANVAGRRIEAARAAQRTADVMGEEEFNISVNAEEAEKIKIAAGLDEEVQREATRIKQAIQGGEVKNDDLRREIDHFLQRRDEVESQADAAFGEQRNTLEKKAKEFRELISHVQNIKEYLNSRERREYLERNPRAEGLYGDIKLTSGEKRELIQLALEGNVEEIKRHFSKLFESTEARTSDSWREAGGSRQQIEVDMFTKGLDDVASKRVAFKDSKRGGVVRELEDWEVDRLRKISRELSQELKLRELLHDVTYYANKDFGIEDLRKLTRQITADEIDYAFETPGVAKVSHYFEQAMLQVMAENGGWLPAEAMTNESGGEPGRVERLVREQIKIDRKLGTLDLEDWHVERAISMARGMNIVTFRTFSIIAKHGIPPDGGGGLLVSWWANNIIKRLAFFRQTARFNVGIERNKFLNMRLEKNGRWWRAKELTETDIGDQDFIDGFINETYNNRFVEQINPAQAGDVFTQTQWRWTGDSDYHAGAIAHLLDGYRYNPVIGAGMWFEKARRLFPAGKTALSKEEISDAKEQLGIDVSTRAELARAIIGCNLNLASEITPLKLFYNMTGLRQDVLRKYYKSSIEEKGKENSGRIWIKDKTMEEDLQTLSAIQEGFLKRRVDDYRKYMEAYYKYKEELVEFQQGRREVKPEKPNRANLYTDEKYANLDSYIRELTEAGKLNNEQRDRILKFTEHIRTEFTGDQKAKLIDNFENKGWKVPFIFGTDDLPYDLYDFSKTGNSLDRRWGDNESVSQAAEVFTKKLVEKMSEFHDMDSLVDVMKEIHDVMKGHDEGRTRDFMFFLSDAIAKYYKADITGRLPFGIGMTKGIIERLRGKGTSAAQILNGPMQMSWDEADIHNFIMKLHEKQIVRTEDIAKLKKRLGAEWWNLWIAVGRTSIPLGIFAFIYYLLAQELKDMKLAA